MTAGFNPETKKITVSSVPLSKELGRTENSIDQKIRKMAHAGEFKNLGKEVTCTERVAKKVRNVVSGFSCVFKSQKLIYYFAAEMPKMS